MIDPDEEVEGDEDFDFDPDDSRTWLKKNDALLSQRTDTQEEIWKPIPIKQFEGLYEVSSLGRVKALPKTTSDGRRLKERIVTPSKVAGGYLQYKLYNDGLRFNVNAHKLVAITFGIIFWNEHSHSEMQINHKDGNKENNSIGNLEPCTPSENLIHAYRTGLRK